MGRLTHKRKTEIARKMRTRQEEADGVSIWHSRAWSIRVAARANKESQKQYLATQRQLHKRLATINK